VESEHGFATDLDKNATKSLPGVPWAVHHTQCWVMTQSCLFVRWNTGNWHTGTNELN